jgi:hypothetical protein
MRSSARGRGEGLRVNKFEGRGSIQPAWPKPSPAVRGGTFDTSRGDASNRPETARRDSMTDDSFQTQDITLTALLLLRGHALRLKTDQLTRRKIFVFPASPEIEAAAKEFYAEATHVEPRAFIRRWHDVRSMLRA